VDVPEEDDTHAMTLSPLSGRFDGKLDVPILGLSISRIQSRDAIGSEDGWPSSAPLRRPVHPVVDSILSI
jgi:hypothetical protein